MTENSAHLSEWTLEQLAEGSLSEAERVRALKHLHHCARCEAELQAFRALIAALSELPRFAPSPGFQAAVLSQVQVAPQTNAVLGWVQRWLPDTPRGWLLLTAGLLAPALPLLVLFTWVLSQPLVSPAALWQWTSLKLQAGTQTLVLQLLSWGSSSPWISYARAAYEALAALPLGTLGILLSMVVVAIPLAVWSLVRLTRTPMENVTYAN